MLNLRHCNISGTIPSFLQCQYDLRYIDLSDNSLVDAFPTWFLQNNTKVKIMFLFNNFLTGILQLPKSKSDLLHLVIFNNSLLVSSRRISVQSLQNWCIWTCHKIVLKAVFLLLWVTWKGSCFWICLLITFPENYQNIFLPAVSHWTSWTCHTIILMGKFFQIHELDQTGISIFEWESVYWEAWSGIAECSIMCPRSIQQYVIWSTSSLDR